jgi:hypothetical protein
MKRRKEAKLDETKLRPDLENPNPPKKKSGGGVCEGEGVVIVSLIGAVAFWSSTGSVRFCRPLRLAVAAATRPRPRPAN